jgi:hypothetical protein
MRGRVLPHCMDEGPIPLTKGPPSPPDISPHRRFWPVAVPPAAPLAPSAAAVGDCSKQVASSADTSGCLALHLDACMRMCSGLLQLGTMGAACLDAAGQSNLCSRPHLECLLLTISAVQLMAALAGQVYHWLCYRVCCRGPTLPLACCFRKTGVHLCCSVLLNLHGTAQALA